jgi:hypothetical protein
MGQTPDEITQNLAERLCWEIARRGDSRVARRLYRKPLVDGVYRLDKGALLDDFFHLDAATKMPLAVKVGQIHEHEALWARALVTQARMHVAGDARLHQVVFDQGLLDGPTCGGSTSMTSAYEPHA